MRQRLAPFTVAAVVTVAAVTGFAGAAFAAPTQPVLYMAGEPIYPGVIYTGAIGNVDNMTR